ncbi:di-heme oxidoredictase family protein [Leptolyngbya sp. AN02str]|uniref:di-heme oxidoreductase family protein n=1 Tax=Leptolyngbya sp. AN02str TaxID=3423363 RepID=UPI003D31C30E
MSLIRRKRHQVWVLGAIAALAGIWLSLGLHTPVRSQTVPLAGGDTTIRNRTSTAYSQPAPNLDADTLALHLEGDRVFDSVFVTPPAPVNPGLGPLFNNASCTGCHIKDGRGMPTKGQLLVRVSQAQMPDSPPAAEPLVLREHYHPEAAVSLGDATSVPGIGTQVQEHAVYGFEPEAQVHISWRTHTGIYGDGTSFSLRSPQIAIRQRNGQPLSSSVMTSPRIPAPVFGLGLLEAVPEADILQLADPDDRDGNGISGKPNYVWDVEKQAEVLGRFGWKANNPTLLQQNAAAYVNDMGVTNPLFPEPDGSVEVSDRELTAATVYVQTLGVPARTLLDNSQVQQGERLFANTCASCHIPTLQTGNHPIAALAQQTIHPYTDLLLHDMGTGLADQRPDFRATGTEWRTPPLWGIGLTQTVLPYSGFLHDGRARTLEEAILWHGGEAEAAKEQFRTMSQSDRAALIQFLRSL